MSADTFEFSQGIRETLRGTLHDPAATPGNVLTVQGDGSIAAAPGGGATEQATYAGNGVSVPNGAQVVLTVNGLVAGADLLNIPSPASPQFRTPGIYALALTVSTNDPSLTVGGMATAQLETAGAATYSAGGVIPGGVTAAQFPLSVTVALLVTVDSANQALRVYLYNDDGVAAHTFQIVQLGVIKLT